MLKQIEEILACKKVPKWRIDKNFLAVKLVYFCWFAGSSSILAFLPVFLKHEGLTISHLSMFIGISVFMQFSITIVAGNLSDKIGRVKPFWYFFFGLTCMSCFCFTILPRVYTSNIENSTFVCYGGEMLNINATSCRFLHNNSGELSCSEISMNNEKNLLKQNETSQFIVTLFPKFNVSLEMENSDNISGIYSSISECSNCSFKNNTHCNLDSCTPVKIECLANFVESNNHAKFWIIIYGILVTFHEVCKTIVFRFNDVIASGIAIESNSDFGRQRLFAIFGSMVGPPLVGFILTKINGSDINKRSYSSVFFSGIIFSVLSAFAMRQVNPKFHKPASKMWKNSVDLGKNMDIVLFFVLQIVMGSVMGFLITYRNWYLKELGASDLLTGVVSGSVSLYGIPFLYNSKWIINKIGIRNMFILGLLGHVVYSFSYSILREPWTAVIIESTTIVSYHLFWVAVIQYAHLVAPEGLEASMKAITGSLHFNVGKLGSSLIAGYVMHIYGGSVAFTVLGCIASAYLLVYGFYLLVQHFKQRKLGTQLEMARVAD